MCLLPAYQTMLSAARMQQSLFTTGHTIKISRPNMAQCVVDSQVMLTNDKAIQQCSRRLEDSIHEQLGRSAPSSML